MQSIEKLLSTNSNYILAGLIISFFLVETILNRAVTFKSRFKHLFQNFLLQSTVLVMASLLALISVFTFDWIRAHEFGLFHWISVPFWLKIILGIFILDMADYWIHRVDHTSPLLWRQHRVHHSDTSMDASTALRTFPTDTIYFLCGELFFAVIFGLDILSMNIFLFIFLPVSFFHHSNLRYPDWLDKAFGWLIVTPNYHKVHHEQDQTYTDSNYGTLFIIWDKAFKTKPVKDIKYGLKEFEGDKKQSVLFLIRSPFITIQRNPDTDDHDPK